MRNVLILLLDPPPGYQASKVCDNTSSNLKKIKSIKLQRGNQNQTKLKSQNHTLKTRGTAQDGGAAIR